MALHVSKEPRGRAEFGEVRKDSMSSDDAAITAGSMSAEMIFAAERSYTEAAMSSTWRGRSSMNRSMEQSLKQNWPPVDTGKKVLKSGIG